MISPAETTLKPRILLVEDDPDRILRFRHWLENTSFVLIEASSAGRALGILRKGMSDGIAGIALDHDLNQQPITESDMSLSGSSLIDSIAASIPRHVPILIHSMNAYKPPQMQRRLEAAGFSVTRIGMDRLSGDKFAVWLQEVHDNWE
jgi:CheY-like chemotaxis protein